MDSETLSSDETPIQPEETKGGFKKIALPALGIISLIVIAAITWYLIDQSKYISTDAASISAPLIQLTPQTTGILKLVLVKEGDTLRAHQPVARVGTEMITTEVAGQAITVKQDIGAVYNPGQPVVTMIDPNQLRVVASVEEDKGLNDIQVGQSVNFTVDAYGSEQFHGTVDEIADTSKSGDVVFNISDKRQEQNYDIKIKYDRGTNPPFQNGMSAKVWIIKHT